MVTASGAMIMGSPVINVNIPLGYATQQIMGKLD